MVLLEGPAAAGGEFPARAAAAEDAVLRRFVAPYRRLPGTRLARTIAPAATGSDAVIVDGSTPFHYWWQAHLLGAVVDGGWRRLRTGDAVGARQSVRLGHRLLAAISLRNGGTLANHYFDDMAWLALAVDALASLEVSLGQRWRHASLGLARRHLMRHLRLAVDGAGAVVWNRDRDFFNAATAGPVALHLARSGRRAEARRIVEWLYTTLFEPQRGLIRDGVRQGGALVGHVYTYNQGTTLAALLELGRPEDLRRAEALVHATGAHLTTETAGRRVLVTHGGGDGGLFTGILVRHLADAASDPRLKAVARREATGLVRATGDALWEGRDPVTSLFPPSGPNVELSTQLQGWLVMEAAARLGG